MEKFEKKKGISGRLAEDFFFFRNE